MLRQFFILDTQNRQLMKPGFIPINADGCVLGLGDEMVLCLTPMRWDGAAWVASPADAGTTYEIGIKKRGSFFSGTFLAFADVAAFNLSGDWPERDANVGELACRLALTDPALLAAFRTNDVEVDVDYLDFVLQLTEIDANGKRTLAAQQAVRILKSLILGSEDLSTQATPLKPTLAECKALFMAQNTDGGDFRVKDGLLQKINKTTGLWHSWGFETVGGVITIWLSETGEA